jgi:hypothetical protein
MGTHGRSGFMRIALGSDAETVVHGSTVPVMLVRGKLRAKNEAPAGALMQASAA